MLKNMSIRWRLTVQSVLLLTLCCVGLTAILNISASRMATNIEAAIQMMPAQSTGAQKDTPQSDTQNKPAQSAAVTEPKLDIQSVPEQAKPDSHTAQVMIPAESTQAARTRFSQQSMFYMVLVVTLGGVLTYHLSGKALKPLQELSEQMKKRTVHNLSEKLLVPESRDEIAELTVSFNEMSAKLEDAFAMQKRFSQSAAHELRTPLTVLKTKVEVFCKTQEHTPQDYEKLLAVITAHTNRLAELVKELLELTNMDALDCKETIALNVMLNEILEELSGIAEEKNLSVTLAGQGICIAGNRSLLYRALYNLLENAIHYNVVGGSVTISLSAVGDKTVIAISDTGSGIPPEAKDLIFEPFYRVDKSRSRQMGGAGLGLATAKSITEKHGGTLCVTDNLPRGTIFTLTL